MKDPTGKDNRHYIFDAFFNTMNEKGANFVGELEPVFRNVTRRLAKDSDGVEKLNKQVRITFEDFDLEVRALQAEFEKMNETMTMVLQYFEDPADQFKLRMPREFEKAKKDGVGVIGAR